VKLPGDCAIFSFPFPLQNPTLDLLVAEGVTAQDGKQGCGPPKLRCEASCRRLRGTDGDSSVANDPFRAPGSTPSYVCLPPAWRCVVGDSNSPSSRGTVVDFKKSPRGKMAKVLTELRFRPVGKHFLWNQATVIRFRYARHFFCQR
jgi:hypothetical protein